MVYVNLLCVYTIFKVIVRCIRDNNARRESIVDLNFAKKILNFLASIKVRYEREFILKP